VTERLLGTAGLARAAALLLEGELVAFGTETVYGLGADATNAAAVAQIFEAKGRPHFNPLICHYPDADAAFRDVMPNPTAELAVRVPSGTVALELLHAVGRSVAAPSANRSGQVSPTSAEHVLDGLGGRIAAVLDSGPCPVGIESTVLDLSAGAPFLLRPGGVTEEAIEAEIGRVGRALTPGRAEASRTLRSPGLLVSHYAPRLPVRLNARSATPDEAVLAFGPPPPGSSLLYQLSERAELAEAAARLFDGLRWLDAEGLARGSSGIAVSPIPDVGLGRAINDRLQRAAVAR
jgi:L-threonylcarbamoyladenylate synthase